ncbi:MAG: ABC transporter substrate-binding protein [Ruminococcaceae bacterium]|nr:ABC transporter substrate-binding protein [Oscillospiraceae bacterium]
MKRTKKITALILLIAMTAIIALTGSACGDTGTYTVGICQLTTHVALDAATEGFKQALIDELGEENVTFDYQNAAGDSNTCTTIANNFVSKNVDLIMANATAALQASASATTTIPILGTSITEYGVALNIENFTGTVGGNISGTSDLAPLTEQAQMIIDLFPEAKTVGLLYCSAEPNSAYQVKVVREYLEGKGLTCLDFSFSDSNDVAVVTEKASTDSDVIYIPTDNTAADCTEIINNICLPKQVPIFAGEAGICSGCGVYTLSISYYEIGYKTGLMAAQILTGEADISQMPIEYDPNPVKKYNAENCSALGLTAPSDYVVIE